MKKSTLVDAAIGLVLTAFVAGSYLISLPLLESVELKAYDMRSQLRQNLDPASPVVLVAIDDDAIAAVGRWPWPRTRLAALVDKLAAAKPKTIGLDLLLSEPEQNQGLLEIEALKTRYEELVASKQIVDKKGAFAVEFASSAVRLDSDSKLLASLQQAGNVVLPMFFSDGAKLGSKPEDLPLVFSTSVLSYQMVPGMEMRTLDGTKANYPIVSLAEAAAGVGHVNVSQDVDGKLRREDPVYRYGDYHFPSYAVQLVLHYTGVSGIESVFTPGQSIQMGPNALPLDRDSKMLITYNGPEETFRHYKYQDLMNDKVSADVFKDKIVIVGPTALGVATVYTTPLSNNLAPIEMIANVIENILHKKFLSRPPWVEQLEWGMIGLIGLFIMVLLPRLKALSGALLSLLLFIGMTGAGTYLFLNGSWVKVAYPSILLGLGYLVITSKRFLVTEKGKELVEASAIETNKMLGLSFQGQGMYDMAFEKFRLCPLDDNMKDTLYNLALDFERKRQFSKAAAVLGHIHAKDPKYKDVEAKMNMLKQASDGAVFGGVGGPKKDGTVMIAGGSTKPTLGRYEIEKELGRGAMGIVYLGKDPKINRMVAIKTMMLEEGDAATLKEVKERFFREAESAGTLNHPNIVRIFDAGEENDISYIAMELLDGKDLTQCVTKETLVPPVTAMEYVATVADALDYAHAQGIVHRDIKPANIMLLKDGTIRVADFGIARITASSKTATGTVMGTPSYMSPEQVAGKKVDGRADLFSLTVALFEFLTGEKPFKGGEGIGTLLFQIANDPHPDVLSIRADLPPCVSAIINKGLAKDPEARYARGSLLASDLRACVAAIKSGVPMAAPAAAPVPAPVDLPPSPVLAPEVAALVAPLPSAPSPDATLTLPRVPAAETTRPQVFEFEPAPVPVAAAPAPAAEVTLAPVIELEPTPVPLELSAAAAAEVTPPPIIEFEPSLPPVAAPAAQEPPVPTLKVTRPQVFEFEPSLPAVPAAPAAAPEVPGIELGARPGPSPDATIRMPAPVNPDATIRIERKQEPS